MLSEADGRSMRLVSFSSVQKFLKSLMEDAASKKESEQKPYKKTVFLDSYLYSGQRIFHTIHFTSNLFFPGKHQTVSHSS